MDPLAVIPELYTAKVPTSDRTDEAWLEVGVRVAQPSRRGLVVALQQGVHWPGWRRTVPP
jgi:hypothetical protein